MRIEFNIKSGSRAGQRQGFDKNVITIGRHPSCDFRFDAEKDPDVSTRHAEIHISGTSATLKDLNSTNGTYVNGQRVQGDRGLGNGDVISFGEHGPKAEVVAPELAPSPTARAPKRDTQTRIAEAVEAQTGMMRKMIGGLAVLVVIGVGAAFYIGNKGASDAKKQIAALIAHNDSLAQAVAAITGKSASVDSAVQAERTLNAQLRRRLEAASSAGDQAAITALSNDLQNSSNRQRGLIGSAQVDWEAVAAKNSAAMVFLVVEMADGSRSTGTGFNVSPSGFIVTNKHVVRDEKGQNAARVVGKFEGASGIFKPTRIVKVSETDELAWLKIEIPGKYPTIQCIARSAQVRVGAPAALIGYPLGTGTAGNNAANLTDIRPASTMTLGAASKVLPDILQLDIFAAQGSSGSPVFNAEGCVVGVLYGSPTESGGRIIYSVPAAKLVAQMPPEGAAIVR
jgi:S1-C subfamily serine protease